MIYENLWDNMETTSDTGYKKKTRIFTDPTRVFPEFAAEAMECLWSKIYRRVKLPLAVEEYIRKNEFGVGVTPADAPIKSPYLFISMYARTYAEILADLDFLLAMDVAKDSELTIVLDHEESLKTDSIHEFFPTLKPVIKRFEQVGSVRVESNLSSMCYSLVGRLDWTETQWRGWMDDIQLELDKYVA